MKRLFICETPFQIIVALILRYQLLKENDINDIIVVGSFRGYKTIAENLRKTNIFNNVIVFDNWNSNKKLKRNIVNLFYILFPGTLKKNLFNKNVIYDEMYCWNYDYFTGTIRDIFTSDNCKIKCFIFEEGYISYLPYEEINLKTISTKIFDFKHKIFRHGKISRNYIDGIYVFEPTLMLYNPNCKIYKINRDIINNSAFIKNIDAIFNASKVAKRYDKKVIIFEENHPEYLDEKLFKSIIDKVGKENVIIKLHPRRLENRFEKYDIKTLGNDGVPWEAITFFEDFSNKILISIGSGSITSYRMLFGEKGNSYLLYKFLSTGLVQFDEKYNKFWNGLESKNDNIGIHFPKTEKFFFEMLNKNLRSDKE